MFALRLTVAGLLVLGLAAGASAESHEALMQEVAALGDSLTQAMLDNDVDTLMAAYTEDAISLPNFGPRMQGVEAFKKHHAEMTGAGMKILSFESDPTNVWQAGDHVIEIGTFAISLNVPGMSEPVQDQGKYMTVYVRDEDGSLKIKVETWNTDMNPMEMGGHSHEHGGEAKPEAKPEG